MMACRCAASMRPRGTGGPLRTRSPVRKRRAVSRIVSARRSKAGAAPEFLRQTSPIEREKRRPRNGRVTTSPAGARRSPSAHKAPAEMSGPCPSPPSGAARPATCLRSRGTDARRSRCTAPRSGHAACRPATATGRLVGEVLVVEPLLFAQGVVGGHRHGNGSRNRRATWSAAPVTGSCVRIRSWRHH
jgi:hypothetical protein